MAYWRHLGLTDPGLVERLGDECLHRAQRRVVKGADEELLRRALEEAQRRFDHALARAAHLPPSNDHHPVAAARAAFLMAADRFSADALFDSTDPPPDFGPSLQEFLPHSTPPEARLVMPETPLRFWLFKSTHQR